MSTLDQGYGALSPAEVLAQQGFNPDGTQMDSAQQEAYKNPTSAPQTTTGQPVVTHTQNFNAAAINLDTFQDNFMASLGIEKGILFGYKGIGMLSPEKDLRNIIGTKTPNEFLDALAKADPALQELTDGIKKDPELAKSLHTAIVKDPSMLAGLQSIASAGEDAFNLSDFNRMLADTQQRDVMRRVLDKVAEGADSKGNDVSFAHVQQLLDHQKNGDNAAMLATLQDIGAMPDGFGIADFLTFFKELMVDPEKAVNNLVNKFVDTGMLGAEDADMAKGFLVPLGDMLEFMGRPYYKLGVKYKVGANTIPDMIDRAEDRGAETRKKHGAPDTTFSQNADGTEPSVEVSSNSHLAEKGEFKDAANGVTVVNGGEAAADMDQKITAKVGNNNNTYAMTG